MRDKYIDYLKGFLIFLVVWGHAYRGQGGFFWLIFRFHMPLFFIISGYLFNNKRKFWSFTKHKFNTLIIPYIIYFLIAYILTMLFINEVSLIDAIKAFILQGKYLDIIFSWSLWYLPFFFFASIIFYPMSKIKDNKWLILITCFLFLLTVPTYKLFDKLFVDEFFPLSLQALPGALGYMSVGLLYNRYKDRIKIPYKYLAILVTVCFFIGIGILMVTTKSQIIKINTYRYVAGSLLIIPFIILITKDNHNKIIEYLGKNSLVILGLHSILIHILKRRGGYDYLLSTKLSSECVFLLVTIFVIFIVCLFNEVNLYLKNKVYKKTY